MERIPRAKDFMIKDVITFHPDTDVYEAIHILLERKISGTPIVQDDKIVGVLSEKDCLRILANGKFHELPGGSVSNYMSTPVHTIHPDADIFAVADIFLKNHFRRVPVVKDGKLVGQISRRDILRAIQEEDSSPIEDDKDYGYITNEMKASLSEGQKTS